MLSRRIVPHRIPAPLRRSIGLLAVLLASACGGEVLSAGTTDPPANPDGAAGVTEATALFTFDGTVQAITMDGSDIYLSTDESVYRVARDGKQGGVVLAPTMTRFASSIVVDDTNVYWTALISGVNGGAILTTPKTGGAAVLLASGQARPVSIAVDDTHVYWTNEGVDAAGRPEGGGAVMSVPKAGGATKVLAGDLSLATAIALDGDGVIWKDHYTIRRIGKTGGPITTIESRIDPFSVNALVVANGHVFYSSSGSLFSAPTDGSAGPKVLAPVPFWAHIAVHDQAVYFNGPDDTYGSIMSVPTNGSAPPQMISGAQPKHGDLVRGSYRILADEKAFYWTDYWANKADGMHTAVRAVVR
jgi:hypothetical protein